MQPRVVPRPARHEPVEPHHAVAHRHHDPAVLVAVEKEPPFDVAVFKLDEDVLYTAEQDLADLMGQLKRCHETGTFPGRYEGEQALHLPAWAYPEDDFTLEEAG